VLRLSLLVGSLLLVAAASPAPASAQTRTSPRMRFAEMDANKDGVISRKEWRGTEASFAVHDWNTDGVLARAEVRPGARRPAQSAPPGDFANPDLSYLFTDWTLAGFYRLDHNGDGGVSRAEWHFNGEAFNRTDHNRDGSLSRAEFVGSTNPDEDDDREDTFANLDGDRDGRLARGEWHGGKTRFDALDQDHDGMLTRAEVVGTAEETAPDLFTSVDVNRDGSITRDEWHWSRASFDARDPNNDGRIAREEAASGAVPVALEQAHRDGYERGVAEGRLAGQRDRERGIESSVESHPEWVRADGGYPEGSAARVAYQAGYRDGFRRGYREGFTPDVGL
jgi:Ca2+-binding EF-hand superfamily protein